MSDVHRYPLAPGTRWGGYEIERVLGNGIEGAVYKAASPSGSVALKVPFNHPTASLRLAFEAHHRRWAEARVPGVANRMFAASLEGERYIATELCERGSLEREFAQGALSDAAMRDLGARLKAMCDAVWQAGLYYFDLRADNVLLEDDGTPRLIDWGAAIPVSPLLRFERWPYAGDHSLPVRGRGWVYAPFDGPDYLLSHALLAWHGTHGRSPFPVRKLRDFMLGTIVVPELEVPLSDASITVNDERDSEIAEWLASDSPQLSRVFSPAALCEISRYDARIVPVRLLPECLGWPDVLARSVFEQLRVQSRFVSNQTLQKDFADVTRDLELSTTLPRLAPLLWGRLDALALRSNDTPLSLEAQARLIVQVFEALAPKTLIVLIGSAWPELKGSRRVRFLQLSEADALLSPTAPISVCVRG